MLVKCAIYSVHCAGYFFKVHFAAHSKVAVWIRHKFEKGGKLRQKKDLFYKKKDRETERAIFCISRFILSLKFHPFYWSSNKSEIEI